MKKLSAIIAAATLFLILTGTVQAATIVNFDGVAIRPASDGSNEYGTITEYATEDGVTTDVPKAGQKVYYGTDYFNGWALSDIEYIEFSFRKGVNEGNDPYSNIVITDGTNFGIISSQGGPRTGPTTPNFTFHRRFDYAANSGNAAYGFKFYEPSPDGGSWSHGTNLVWNDIKDWKLLGIGDSRPLYSGEGSSPRGPVDDAIAIMWGDSAANYLGIRDIFDVVVYAKGQEYCAGPIPEPTTMLLLGFGLIGLAGTRRKLS